MSYTIQSQRLYRFATEAAGIVCPLVHISALCSLSFNAVKGKARFLQASNTRALYSGKFYGDVLHEGIAGFPERLSRFLQRVLSAIIAVSWSGGTVAI